MKRFITLADYLRDAHYISGNLIGRIMDETDFLKDCACAKYFFSDEFKLIVEGLDCIWYQYPNFPTRSNHSLAFTGSTALTVSNDWIKHLFKAIVDKNLSAPSCNRDDIISEFKKIVDERTRKILDEKKINIFDTTVYGYNWIVRDNLAKKPGRIQKYLGWTKLFSTDENTSSISARADAFNAYPLLTYIIEERDRAKLPVLLGIEQAIQDKTSLSAALRQELDMPAWMIKKLSKLTVSDFKLTFDVTYENSIVEDFLDSLLDRDNSHHDNSVILTSLNLAAKLKPEICPRTDLEWQCFKLCSLTLERLYSFLPDPNQRITDVLQTIQGWNDETTSSFKRLDFEDIENDFHANLIGPILLLLNKDQTVSGKLVKNLLWLNRTSCQILITSKDWHAQQRMIRDRLSSKFPVDKNSIQTWPALVEKYSASNGYTIESLCSRTALRNEGEIMKHCVGGYADHCIWHQKHIVSIRSDQHHSIRSTVELKDNFDTDQYKIDQVAKLHVIQHRAIGNSSPNQNAQIAINELIRDIAENRILIDVNQIVEHRQQAILRGKPNKFAARSGASYYCSDNWQAVEEAWTEYSGILSKPLKQMNLSNFCEHIEKMLTE